MDLDRTDLRILSELVKDARASHTELSERVGLSSTAIARRIRALEESGVIKGYQADIDLRLLGLATTVVVRISLASQSEEALRLFEVALKKCPSVVSCFLLSGNDDYIVTLLARGIEDYERIHMTELSRLPGVSRICSSFAIREVIGQRLPLALVKGAAI